MSIAIKASSTRPTDSRVQWIRSSFLHGTFDSTHQDMYRHDATHPHPHLMHHAPCTTNSADARSRLGMYNLYLSSPPSIVYPQDTLVSLLRESLTRGRGQNMSSRPQSHVTRPICRPMCAGPNARCVASSPEAAPSDVMLAQILQAGRLRQQLVHLLLHVQLLVALEVRSRQLLLDPCQHLQRPCVLHLARFRFRLERRAGSWPVRRTAHGRSGSCSGRLGQLGAHDRLSPL